MATLMEVFKATADVQQVSKLEQLVGYAAPILDLVRDTFPTYTLHNHVHAENVIRLMEQLLGEKITSLSGLEAEMLILSAYFHDIGMVFSEEEKAEIQSSQDFKRYLESHPAEYLLSLQSEDSQVQSRIVEGYCRWSHADRVAIWLQRVPDELLQWDSVSITAALNYVCRSHNWPVAKLKDSFFDEDFLGECDLRMCAILLRLADILDFDNTRSPDSVYQYLGLSNHDSPRKHNSDIEWRKHLKTGGFKFPRNRKPEYELTINAGPDHPAVESDIREFLTAIENELAESRSLLRYCSERWTDLSLPGSISRKGIISHGYVFGDFRFRLDRTAILDLFMGENLYSDPAVFFREIIQNSVDAIRARCELEGIAVEDSGYRICVDNWTDANGYDWISIDDDGIGMDLTVVENYLLTIGSSYYSSPEYRAQLARNHGRRAGSHHVPISKFGVGLLSSFMVSSQIELTTRKIPLQGVPPLPVRVSFNHLADYFVVQSPDHKATRFPTPSGGTDGYRPDSRPGTSIAIKIDPTKYIGDIDAKLLTGRFTLASRIPIVVNGERHRDVLSVRDLPSDGKVRLPLNWTTQYDFAPDLLQDISAIELTVSPLNFKFACEGRSIDGVGDAFWLDITEFNKAFALRPPERLPFLNLTDSGNDLRPAVWDTVREAAPQARFSISYERRITASLSFYHYLPYRLEQLYADFEPTPAEMHLLYRLRASSREASVEADLTDIYKERAWARESGDTFSSWSHNGVRLPPVNEELENLAEVSGSSRPNVAQALLVLGSMWLEDDLRPDLNIARDKILRVPFPVTSAVELALMRALKRELPDNFVNYFSDYSYRPFIRSRFDDPTPSLAEILSDPLTVSPEGWAREELFVESGTGRRFSVPSLRTALPQEGPIRISPAEIDTAQFVVLDLNFFLHIDRNGEIIVSRARNLPSTPDPRLLEYAPATFLPYESKEYFIRCFVSVYESSEFYRYQQPNLDHNLVQWFLGVAPFLRRRAPGLEKAFLALHDLPADLPPTAAAEKIRECVMNINRLIDTRSLQYEYPIGVESILVLRTDMDKDNAATEEG